MSMVTPGPDSATEPARIWFEDGSSASAVIDLANDSPEPRGLWRIELPARPVMLGHCVDYHNGQSPILTDGIMHAPGCVPAQVCEGCNSEVIVATDPRFTFLIANHQPGCPRYAELAERLAS